MLDRVSSTTHTFFFLVVLEGVKSRSPSSGTPRVYQGDRGATKATHDTLSVNEFLLKTGGTSLPGHSPTHVDQADSELFRRRARLGREGSDDHSYPHWANGSGTSRHRYNLTKTSQYSVLRHGPHTVSAQALILHNQYRASIIRNTNTVLANK